MDRMPNDWMNDLPPVEIHVRSADAMFDRVAGRLYATCMVLYCLEVYYRHMPIYESPW